MAVRRLHPDQPAHFAFTPENLAWVKDKIAQYPPGKEASAVVPVLWRAQEQIGGWITEPAIRLVADLLGMAYIRVYEIATFYTMFQLAPVGAKAHIQVCGTTPCMLRGAQDLVTVCKRRIAPAAHEVSPDGSFSWEEVECLGSCANAPMVQVGADTYEDLTPESFESLIDALAVGSPPPPGSQTGRQASCPEGGATSLTDPTLYDGSRVGMWQRQGHSQAQSQTPALAQAAASSAGGPVGASPAPEAAKASSGGSVHPAALAAMANAGLVKELEARGGGKAMPAGELAKLAEQSRQTGPEPFGAKTERSDASGVAMKTPDLLAAPRNGAPDDLKLIWGVAEKLEERMNSLGIWHYDQIAAWTPEEVAWFESEMSGFKGRIVRDQWQEQCRKLAQGWRPDSAAGERPKD